jgi:hypothetical protein
MLKHLWGCLQATADKIVALLLAHPHLRLDDVAVISRNVNMDRLLLQLYVSVWVTLYHSFHAGHSASPLSFPFSMSYLPVPPHSMPRYTPLLPII